MSDTARCLALPFALWCILSLPSLIIAQSPAACDLLDTQTNVIATLCPTSQDVSHPSTGPLDSVSWCSTKNLAASVPIAFTDPLLLCNDTVAADCVAAPYMVDAMGVGTMDRDDWYIYTKHAVPFELSDGNDIYPLLAMVTIDGFSIVDLSSNTIKFDTNGSDWTSTNAYVPFDLVEIVSPSAFVNKAYLIGVSAASSSAPSLHTITITISPSSSFELTVDYCSLELSDPVVSLSAALYLNGATQETYAALANEENVFFYLISQVSPSNPACAAATPTVTWTLSNAPAPIQKIKFFVQEQPDHSVNVTYGCFPALATRTLVMLASSQHVYVLGFSEKSNGANLDLSENGAGGLYLFYTSNLYESITDIDIFGECFGNIDKVSQMLWLSVAGGSEATGPYLNIVSLDEFALADFACQFQSDWWMMPTGYRGVNGSTCNATVTAVCNPGYYATGTTPSCAPRTTWSMPLPDEPRSIQSRLVTANATVASPNLANDFLHVIFVSTNEQQSLVAYGFQEKVCKALSPEFEPEVSTLNTIVATGRIVSVHASSNGQHVFVSLMKPVWEVQSQIGGIAVCAAYNNDTSNKFLTPYQAYCEQVDPQPFTPYSYLGYFSECSSGVLCSRFGDIKNATVPDLNNTVTRYPDSEFYSVRPVSQFICPEGFYCPALGQRAECPPGFVCPNKGLLKPQACAQDWTFTTTCADRRLLAPKACPEGAICSNPGTAPYPAPPGTYITLHLPRSDIFDCRTGEYCPLAVSNTTNTNGTEVARDLLCPGFFFCNTSAVITPTQCHTMYNSSHAKINDNTTYCPSGSNTSELCPAGYFCRTPKDKELCKLGNYCPLGSQEQVPCPAGSYCPSPSEKYICPKHNYCRSSVTAPHKCHWLVICPEGTDAEKTMFGGGVFDVVVLIIIAVAYFTVNKAVDHFRTKRYSERATYYKRLATEDARMSMAVPIASGGPDLAPQFTMDFEFCRMGLRLKHGGKMVLSDISGHIRHGRVTAVMGPSGSGKTTFLTTLAGKASYGDRTGQVLINGEPSTIAPFKKVVGFVPQEDVMHRELTVKEIIRFCADTRLPSHLTSKEKTDMTNRVIQILGLFDVRHSFIGNEETRGISGGQRKRVNIGMELVTNPTVLFLDEPTSGLDSTSSDEVVTCLQAAAKLGLTVVAVLHQPRYETYIKFDDVLLLGKGGRTVYFGAGSEALAYFESLGFRCPEHTNPPDFFMDIISGRVPRIGDDTFEPDQLFHLWERHYAELDFQSVYQRKPAGESGAADKRGSQKYEPIGNPYPEESTSLLGGNRGIQEPSDNVKRSTAGIFKQFWLFLVRAFVQQWRDLRGLLTDCVLVFVAGTLLGALYTTDNFEGPPSQEVVDQCPPFIEDVCRLPRTDKLNALGMLIALSVGLTALTSSLRTFGQERVVFWREASSGINKTSYFFGKMIAQLPLIAISPVVFLSVFYALTSPRGIFVKYYVTLLLLQWAYTGYGYMLSIVLPQSRAILAGVVFSLICAMFGGTNPTLKDLNASVVTRIFSSLSPNRWAQEALYVIEVTRYSDEYSIASALSYWGFEQAAWPRDLIAMLIIGVATRVLTLVLLYIKDRDKMK